MYPWLLPDVFGHTIPLYDVFILIGIFFMMLFVSKKLDLQGYTVKQVNRLLILIVVSLLFALFSSWLFDGVFHSIQEGEIVFGSITFIGGLIGGIGIFLVLYTYFFKYENRNLKSIMGTIITGVVLAHAFGRIGCFFAGCCFGIPTDSFLGVVFPHGHAASRYPDLHVHPTQLYEAAFLFVFFVLLNRIKWFKNKEIEMYLIGYGTWRFLIEFIRGDDRGAFITLYVTEYNVFPTPSQFLSLIMIICGTYLYYRWNKKMKNNEE